MRFEDFGLEIEFEFVIPAKAGIQSNEHRTWGPGFRFAPE
jgi:hypothetical protein